jgi:hypothetical protein
MMRTHDGQPVTFIDHCPNRKLVLQDRLPLAAPDRALLMSVYYCSQCGYWEYPETPDAAATKFVRH